MSVHGHSHSLRKGEVENDYHDLYCSEDFLLRLESTENYRARRITVQVSLSFDAFPTNNVMK